MDFPVINPVYGIIFFLVFSRVLGFCIFAPFFGNRQMPVRLRVMFALSLAFFLMPSLPEFQFPVSDNMVFLTYLIIINLLWGIIIGIIVNMMFAGLQFGAEVYGFQSGFRIVNVVDPMTEENISVLGVYHNIFITFLFIILNGHRILIYYMAQSFYKIPLDYAAEIGIIENVLKLSSRMFIIGIQVGSPIIFAQLILIITIAIFGKAIPQIPIMIVSFPLKIGFGIIGMVLVLRYVAERFHYIFYDYMGYIKEIIM